MCWWPRVDDRSIGCVTIDTTHWLIPANARDDRNVTLVSEYHHEAMGMVTKLRPIIHMRDLALKLDLVQYMLGGPLSMVLMLL